MSAEALQFDLSHEKLSADDATFIKQLAANLLPKVEDALSRKTAEVASSPRPDDSGSLPLGGNIESQQASAIAVISSAKENLEALQNCQNGETADLTCLNRVLNFLIRRGEDWHTELERLEQIQAASKSEKL